MIHRYEPLYFADICAGPGGFSEYVLWRSSLNKNFAKGLKSFIAYFNLVTYSDFSTGFGFTLKCSNDFKLNEFRVGSQEMFEPHYGVDVLNGDGDIYREDNQKEFSEFVFNSSRKRGLHFVMADGVRLYSY